MKKIVIALLCAAFCLSFLAACGDKSDSTPTVTTEQEKPSTQQATNIPPETENPNNTQTTVPDKTTDDEPTTEPVIQDWPVSEEDVKNYVNMVYGKYDLYRFKELNVTSPSQYGSVFPRKDANGSYRAPSFLESKLYKSGTQVTLENGKETSGSILTEAEAQYLSATSQTKTYSAVSVSKIQQSVNEIFGSGRFSFAGSIESGYTKSGYYLIPSTAGDEGAASLDHYTIESVTFDEENYTVSATVTEKWTDYTAGGATVVKKTTLSLRINGTNLSLREIFY